MEDLPPIPPLAQGDRVEVQEITPSQHFTEPPPRFSEASLVKELERLGIGRPSTYSAIISTLSAREYVRVEQRRFFPTELGETGGEDHGGQVPRDLQRRVHLRDGERAGPGRGGRAGLAAGAPGLLRAVHQGAGRGGHERPGGRRSRVSTPRSWPRSAAPSAARRSSSRPGGSGPTSPASSTRTPATT